MNTIMLPVHKLEIDELTKHLHCDICDNTNAEYHIEAAAAELGNIVFMCERCLMSFTATVVPHPLPKC